ncbi:hypothetical protein ACTXGQ_04440 [Marinobacter sp. 1Y8]
MQVQLSTVQKLQLTQLQEASPFRLDPVTVILEDFELGKGKIIIECFGDSWSAFWLAMGKRDIATFFCRCDEHYIAKNLSGISCGIPDYSKLTETAKQEVCRLRRDGELTAEESRSLFVDATQFADAESVGDLDGNAMRVIFGDDWWHAIPEKPNPDYQYLCRIIKAVQEGIGKAGLVDQRQELLPKPESEVSNG